MAIEREGKQSVAVDTTTDESCDRGVWFFCQNGYQSIGVAVSVEQFDMLKKLVTNAEVVEFYESQRDSNPK